MFSLIFVSVFIIFAIFAGIRKIYGKVKDQKKREKSTFD
jgi:hypothetical protein